MKKSRKDRTPLQRDVTLSSDVKWRAILRRSPPIVARYWFCNEPGGRCSPHNRNQFRIYIALLRRS